MTETPAAQPSRAGWTTRGLDAFAYALAVMSIFPAGAAILLLGMFVAGYGSLDAIRSNAFMTTRRTIFEFFRSPLWGWFLGVSVASAILAAITLAIAHRRRKISRLAAAGVRLAMVGLALAVIVAASVGLLAAYRWL